MFKHLFFKKLLLLSVLILTSAVCRGNTNANIDFSVAGLEQNDKAIASLGSIEFYKSIIIENNGSYTISDVPEGKHSIKIELNGYEIPEAITIIVDENGRVIPNIPIKFHVKKIVEDDSKWSHEWHSDESTAGYTTSSYVNTPPKIEFLGKEIVPSDAPSAAELLNNYNIILYDDIEPWTQEYAYRLAQTMKTLPAAYQNMPLAKFSLTSEKLTDDIKVVSHSNGKEVIISKDAFTYANPFLVSLDDVKGRFFSKRLHHAMVKFVTDFGNDQMVVDNILQQRFGCSIFVPDIEELTSTTTGETWTSFQSFVASELVSLINILEEMPLGMHKIPELKYLVRRKNGYNCPFYPDALAVSWTDAGYIEFMEKGFGGNNEQASVHSLILHEKTHFLWSHSFSEELKNEWIAIGGWYVNKDGKWATTKQTEFVSSYAHDVSPNEDMSESVACYLTNPELLMARSPEKYEFIQTRIMHGARYISKIPDHLSFEVLNLFPDYDFPGKIKRISTTVTGKPDEDKRVDIEVELYHIEGYNDGAEKISINLSHPPFKNPDGSEPLIAIQASLKSEGNSHILKGSIMMSKYAKSGLWTASWILIRDSNGLERYENENSGDYVFRFYINNSLEDVVPPTLDPNSITYTLSDTKLEGHDAQMLHIRCKASDNSKHIEGYSRIVRGDADYSYLSLLSALNSQNSTYDSETQELSMDIPVTEFCPTGDYSVRVINLMDKALNQSIYEFGEPSYYPEKKIYIKTSNPDYEKPEIDLNRITVYAEPTNPEAPDGETKVTIDCFARDDKSGLDVMIYQLKDPQGVYHQFDHEMIETRTLYFDGDPTEWKRYTHTAILPKGSVPGIWGIAEIYISDKAMNARTYNFVENLIFEPESDESNYELFATIDAADNLSMSVSGNYSAFDYKITHEETGKSIKGKWSSTDGEAIVNINSLDRGTILVTVSLLDSQNNFIAVKSSKLEKSTISGINDNVIDSDLDFEVTTENGYMHFTNLPKSEKVSILTIDGRTIITGTVSEIESHIFSPAVYIISANRIHKKVMVK